MAPRSDGGHPIGRECGSPRLSPFCNRRSRNPASSLANALNGGVFTTPRNQTSGLSAGLIQRQDMSYQAYRQARVRGPGWEEVYGRSVDCQTGTRWERQGEQDGNTARTAVGTIVGTRSPNRASRGLFVPTSDFTFRFSPKLGNRAGNRTPEKGSRTGARSHEKAINPRGDIVGQYTSGGVVYGYLWRDGIFTTISGPGASSTQATAISARGDIVGQYVAGGVTHGFLLDARGNFATVDVPGASSSAVLSISSEGDLVGQYTAAGVTHGFVLRW